MMSERMPLFAIDVTLEELKGLHKELVKLAETGWRRGTLGLQEQYPQLWRLDGELCRTLRQAEDSRTPV